MDKTLPKFGANAVCRLERLQLQPNHALWLMGKVHEQANQSNRCQLQTKPSGST